MVVWQVGAAPDDMDRSQTFAGRQQALERRFNDFQSKLDITLHGYEVKMVTLHSEIHEEFATSIDNIKKEIDFVWKARTDNLGNFAQELAGKFSDSYHRHIGNFSLLENRSVRAVNEATAGAEKVIRQADLKAKDLSDLTRLADVATDALRSLLLEVERVRSCGTSVLPPQAPDPPLPAFASGQSATLMTSPRARLRHYSPADELIMLAQVEASERACRDESRSPSVRHAAKGALREGLQLLEDCVRGRSPARGGDEAPGGEEAPSDDTLARVIQATLTLSQLESSRLR